MSARRRRRPSAGARAWDDVEELEPDGASSPARRANRVEADGPRALVRRVVENLDGEYGVKHNRPNRRPLDTLVGIVLSHQNSSASSRACFAELKRRFPAWEAVRAAPVEEIEDAIRRGGLARLKAARIRAILEQLLARHGVLDLGHLDEMTPDAAVAELVRLPGVGSKTARCVLLIALGVDVFPMDVHIFRIAERLEIIAPKTPDERAHRIFGALVPEGRRFTAHVNMIEHGRTVCRPSAPRCDACCLLEYCTYGQRRLADLHSASDDPRL